MRVVVLIVVLIVLVVGGLAALSHAPFLHVTSIAVSGNETIASSSIANVGARDMAGEYDFIFAKDDIFLYPKQQIEQDVVARYPAIKSVDVHAQDFHTVAIAIIERHPAALLCNDGCFVMDEDGVVYAPALSTSTPFVVYRGQASTTLPAQFLSQDEFHSLSALVGALSQSQATNTVETVAVNGTEADATFADGLVLKFNVSDASGDVFERFSLALKSAPFTAHALSDFQYLDLRFGDKLYYKLKGQ